jgi:hypothetical protein
MQMELGLVVEMAVGIVLVEGVVLDMKIAILGMGEALHMEVEMEMVEMNSVSMIIFDINSWMEKEMCNTYDAGYGDGGGSGAGNGGGYNTRGGLGIGYEHCDLGYGWGSSDGRGNGLGNDHT